MPATTKQLTKKERAWCFKHAKDHVLEAIQEALTEEHHSMFSVNGTPRADMGEVVMEHMERWYQQIKREKEHVHHFVTDEDGVVHACSCGKRWKRTKGKST